MGARLVGMSTFAVYLNEPNEAAWERIRTEWPTRHFILDAQLALVAPESMILTSDIAKRIGMDEETGGTRGLVMEISSYFGFNRTDLWEWLRKVHT